MRAAPEAKDLILRLVRQPWQSAARNFGMLGIWLGKATPGAAGLGSPRLGKARNVAWRGVAGLGEARHGKSEAWNVARRGSARPGVAWRGKELGLA